MSRGCEKVVDLMTRPPGDAEGALTAVQQMIEKTKIPVELMIGLLHAFLGFKIMVRCKCMIVHFHPTSTNAPLLSAGASRDFDRPGIGAGSVECKDARPAVRCVKQAPQRWHHVVFPWPQPSCSMGKATEQSLFRSPGRLFQASSSFYFLGCTAQS